MLKKEIVSVTVPYFIVLELCWKTHCVLSLYGKVLLILKTFPLLLVKVHEYVYIFLLPKSGYFKDKLRKKRHCERLSGVLMKEVLFHMLTAQIFFSI